VCDKTSMSVEKSVHDEHYCPMRQRERIYELVNHMMLMCPCLLLWLLIALCTCLCVSAVRIVVFKLHYFLYSVLQYISCEL